MSAPDVDLYQSACFNLLKTGITLNAQLVIGFESDTSTSRRWPISSVTLRPTYEFDGRSLVTTTSRWLYAWVLLEYLPKQVIKTNFCVAVGPKTSI
jgi:hypothetical protein